MTILELEEMYKYCARSNGGGFVCFELLSHATICGKYIQTIGSFVVVEDAESKSKKTIALCDVISVSEFNPKNDIEKEEKTTEETVIDNTDNSKTAIESSEGIVTLDKKDSTSNIESTPSIGGDSIQSKEVLPPSYIANDPEKAKQANRIYNIYQSAIKAHALEEKKGKIVAEIHRFSNQFGNDFKDRRFVAEWFETIEEYEEAIKAYRFCNDEDAASRCAQKSGNNNGLQPLAEQERSAFGTDQEEKTEDESFDDSYDGIISYWDRSRIIGMIKPDAPVNGQRTLFFHLSGVKNDDLRNYLYNTDVLNPKLRVRFSLGDNGKPYPAATEIDYYGALPIERKDGITRGFVSSFNRLEAKGVVSAWKKPYEFRLEAVVDPYLRFYLENTIGLSNIDVFFTWAKNGNGRIVKKMIATEAARDEILRKYGQISNSQQFDEMVANKRFDDLLCVSATPSKTRFQPIPRWGKGGKASSLPASASNSNLTKSQFVEGPLSNRAIMFPLEKDPCQRGLDCLRVNPQQAREYFLDAVQRSIRVETALPSMVTALNMLEGDYCDFATKIIDYYGSSLSQEKITNIRISLFQKAKRFSELIGEINKILPDINTDSKKNHFLYMKAQSLFKIQQYDEAVKTFEKSKQIAQRQGWKAFAYNADKGIAVCYYSSGKKTQAKQKARILLKEYPGDTTLQAIVDDQEEAIENNDLLWIDSNTKDALDQYLQDKIDDLVLDTRDATSTIKKVIKNGQVDGAIADVSKAIEKYTETVGHQIPTAQASGWLFLAKVVDSLIKNSNESDETREKYNITPQRVCLYAGKSMLAEGDCLARSSVLDPDVLRFYYAEALKLIPETDFQNDLSNAFNRLFGSYYVSSEKMSDILFKGMDVNAFAQNKSLETEDLKQMFIQSFSLDERSNSRMETLLSNLFDNKKQDAADIFTFAGLKELEPYKTRDQYLKAWNDLKREHLSWKKRLANSIERVRHIEFLSSATELEDHIKCINEARSKLISLDSNYLDQYVGILNSFKRAGSTNDYERREDLYKSIITNCRNLVAVISKFPSLLSYDHLKETVVSIEVICSSLLDNWYQEHAPKLKIQESTKSYLSTNTQSYPFIFSIVNASNVQPADIHSLDFSPKNEGVTFKSDREINNIQVVKSGENKESMRTIVIPDNYSLTYVEFEIIVEYSYKGQNGLPVSSKMKQSFHIDLRSENDFSEIKNKYNSIAAGTAVTGEMFMGRNEDIKKIVEALCTDQGMLSHRGIVLYGQKRAGKSSILANLQKAIEERYGKETYLFFNMGSLGLMVPPLSNILACMIQRVICGLMDHYPDIYNKIKSFGINLDDIIIANNTANDTSYYLGVFERIIKKLESIGGPNRFIPMLFIDEFTYLYQWIISETDPTIKLFPDFWKAFIENNRVCSIVVGQENMSAFTSMPAYSNDFACMQLRKVSFLDDRGARELITKPLTTEDNNCHIDDAAVRKIIELTAGSAYLIVFLCDKMVDYMNDNHIDKMTPLTLRQFVLSKLLVSYEDWDTLFECQTGDTSKVGDELNQVAQDNKTILSSIAQRHLDDYSTKKEDIAFDSLTQPNKEYRDTLLNALVNRDVLSFDKSKNTYKIKIDLLRIVLQYQNNCEVKY